MDVDTDVPMHDAVEDQLDSTLDEEAPGFDNGLASSSPGTSGIADNKATKPVELTGSSIGQLMHG